MSNVALNKTAIASSSIAPYLPARAVDGLTAAVNRWMAHGTPGWLAVDLATLYWINRWVVKQPGGSGWSSPNYNLVDFRLQGSLDNVNWFDMDSVVNNSVSIVDRITQPRQIRYARVYVTRGLRINPSLASIMEFELYDAANGPTLTNVAPANWTLSPAFSSSVLAYTVTVASETTSIQFAPTAPAGMVIKVNGTVVVSGQSSAAIMLNPGNNPVAVTVTSADATMTAAYTINVVRQIIVPTATLKALAVKNHLNQDVVLNPPFASGSTGYTASVINGVPVIRVKPNSDLTGATLTVNGTPLANNTLSAPISLAVGVNTITIVVNATGYSAGTYTILVTRAAP